MEQYQGFLDSPTQLLRAREGFRLAEVDTSATPGYAGGKAEGRATLAAVDRRLSRLQEKLFAASRGNGRDSLLLVLQAMDTAGKGGIVRHVIGAVDPQGVRHVAFKAPSDEERRHDFLWRFEKELPGYGMIGVFDRSHYEDVLVHRVRQLSPAEEIERRYGAINDFEAHVSGGGTRLIKVMLHIGSQEQKQRLAARLQDEEKYWKYSTGDLADRALWDEYQHAYQLAIERTNTDTAPWFVVPADHKWYARIAVQQLLVDALEGMDLRWPVPDFDLEAERNRVARA